MTKVTTYKNRKNDKDAKNHSTGYIAIQHLYYAYYLSAWSILVNYKIISYSVSSVRKYFLKSTI